MPVAKAYEETINFIAGGADSRSVAEYHATEAACTRLMELLHREKRGTLTPEEASELSHALFLEHLMRLAKARARQLLGTA